MTSPADGPNAALAPPAQHVLVGVRHDVNDDVLAMLTADPDPIPSPASSTSATSNMMRAGLDALHRGFHERTVCELERMHLATECESRREGEN